MIPQALSRARSDKRLWGTDLQVLLALYEELDWVEFRHAKVLVLARKTSLLKQNTARALVRLVLFGYLTRGPKDGTLNTYRLANPRQVITGETKQAA